MWLIYRYQRVRRFIGGRWGYISGKKIWVRLNNDSQLGSFDWIENWDIQQSYLRWHNYIYKIDDSGMLLRRDLGDLSETWYAIARVG